MTDLIAKVEAMPPEQRKGAIAILDALTRPLTIREIEDAMVGRGVSRTQRKIISKAIEPMHIIALLGPEKSQ